MKITKKLWCTSLILMFLVSITMINVTSASPDTYFYVDPPLIQGTPTGNFTININVTDAPPSRTWEVRLSWDPDRLELLDVAEGDFLHRWIENPLWPPIPPPFVPEYPTVFATTPLDAANLKGEILLVNTLVGEYNMSEWADGDGWLASIEFLAQAEGDAQLDLFDTSLWDHIDPDTGYAAPTSYPNEDGLVDATNFFFAGLHSWSIKVNGRSGLLSWLLEWLGFLRWAEIFAPRTPVGTENLLESKVRNSGSFDVDVQVFFEVRSAAGYWIATVASDVVPLSAGESTTLSATWTANNVGVYYITAYAFYSAPPYVTGVTIADGSSRAFRLSVEPAA